MCVILSVEHYEWVATNNFADGGLPGTLPEYSHKSLELPGGVSSSGRPYPDVMSYGQREYGKRVGIFRVMDILDKYEIKATVAIDASTASNYPFLIKQFQQRGYEIMAHGIAVNQMISSKMTQDEERNHIRLSI
ncbi:MAG: Peptidoglycan/xylan/chitin deacetylase, PgdA/CDA1 family, partial [Chloroflexi bacterium]